MTAEAERLQLSPLSEDRQQQWRAASQPGRQKVGLWLPDGRDLERAETEELEPSCLHEEEAGVPGMMLQQLHADAGPAERHIIILVGCLGPKHPTKMIMLIAEVCSGFLNIWLKYEVFLSASTHTHTPRRGEPLSFFPPSSLRLLFPSKSRCSCPPPGRKRSCLDRQVSLQADHQPAAGEAAPPNPPSSDV